MKKIIIIKYAELSTKKANINFFLKTLKNNIDNALTCNHIISYDRGRMFISVSEENIDKTIDVLLHTFGIHEIVIGFIDEDRTFEVIANNVLDLIKTQEFKTFKVETKRSDKEYPMDSMEVSKKLGSVILNNKECRVDVHNPEVIIHIEIRKDAILYYTNGIHGLGGYPVGTLGKGLLMLSGGIDSPVAGYLTIKRGVRLSALYFESPPHTSEAAKDKVIKLARVLAKYNPNMTLYAINFTKIQEAILRNIPYEYLITIMRRMMYRIAEKIANSENSKIIVNGESIGQVASQTLTSMSVINSVVNMPVIRPVACFDKLEIIDIAKKIGTFDISTLPYEDCCTVFVPVHPVINPELNKCIEYEKLIPYEELIDEAIKAKQVIKIKEEEKIFEDIL